MDEKEESFRVLCKLRGMLVVAEVVVRQDGSPGSCPECGSQKFTDINGWAECDCGFAYLLSDLERIGIKWTERTAEEWEYYGENVYWDGEAWVI